MEKEAQAGDTMSASKMRKNNASFQKKRIKEKVRNWRGSRVTKEPPCVFEVLLQIMYIHTFLRRRLVKNAWDNMKGGEEYMDHVPVKWLRSI